MADGALWQTYRSGVDEGGVAAWWRDQCRVDFTPEGFAHSQRDLLCCAGWLLAGDGNRHGSVQRDEGLRNAARSASIVGQRPVV